jgi:hypothetical protein
MLAGLILLVRIDWTRVLGGRLVAASDRQPGGLTRNAIAVAVAERSSLSNSGVDLSRQRLDAFGQLLVLPGELRVRVEQLHEPVCLGLDRRNLLGRARSPF